MGESLATSGGGFFQDAHNFTIYQPTIISNTTLPHDRNSIDLLVQNTIPGTTYDASERYPPPSCHPQTRLDISEYMQSWMHGCSREKKLLWLHGPAGVGKSAIMQTLAESEADSPKSILGATLFFSRRDKRNDPRRVFTTLAYQLAVKYPLYRRYVVDLLSNDPRVVEKSPLEQFKWFFVRPFVQQNLLQEAQETVLILLDGLDECNGEAAQRELVTLIGRFVLDNPTVPLIWVIASRPESHIQKAFSHPQVRNSYSALAVPINSTQGCADVEQYLRDKFDDIRLIYADCFPSTLPQWPSESDFLQIASRACGLFVFATTVIRFVEDENYGNPVSQLQAVLRAIEMAPSAGIEYNPFAALDILYTEIISSIPRQVLATTRKLLAFALVRYAPFGIACNWLGLTQADAYCALRKLQSILSIPPPEAVPHDGHLEVFHTSFLDYLLSPARSDSFSINEEEAWEGLSRAMVNVLLQSYNTVDSSVDVSRIELSWSYKEKTLDVQKELFEISLRWFLLFCEENRNLEAYVGNQLAGFFDDLDYGSLGNLLPQISDAGKICFVACNSPFRRILETRNIIQKTTVRSLDLNCLRSGKLASGQMLRRYGRGAPALRPAPTYLLEGIEEMAGPTCEDPYWKTRVLQHLVILLNIQPSPEVFLIGKGGKSCVLILESKDDYLWHYFFPYDQSLSSAVMS
ncbi:hypothetical protein D9756_004659 [Leucocoprinus leucothites]|uniref:NACHT domain-containing protein n=1 Tax=Leucocoprinus leucothites TaxID=201217 RepID=A0A8H5G967_9AGAR|nr:hypothetical protein D9756_004659 [Leucoagaricus leucothites]